MTKRNYYFRIRDANVYECIKAASWLEAKAIATEEWLPYWNQIEWLTPTDHHQVNLPIEWLTPTDHHQVNLPNV